MKIEFKIHIFTYLLCLICAFTGQFKLFATFILIILVHEFGHVFGAILTKSKVEKVIILPFGGITILKYPLNVNILKEFIIVSLGPIFQIILYFVLKNRGLYCFKEINMFLFIFNFLPIIPLDGYRILNLILNKIFSFKFSLYISSYISFLFLILSIIVLFLYKNFIFLITFFFLLYKTIHEYRIINYVYNKFLYERYSKDIRFKKRKKIYSIKNMYRDYIHLIYYNYRFYSEKEFLDIYYKKGSIY